MGRWKETVGRWGGEMGRWKETGREMGWRERWVDGRRR